MLASFSSRYSRRDILRTLAAAGLAGGLSTTIGGRTRARAAGRARVAQAAAQPAPQWDQVYGAALGNAMGYAYAVAQNGQPTAGAGVHLARSASEQQNPSQPWSLDTLFNLASVSKTLTAVAIMTMVEQQGPQLLDTPFWGILTVTGNGRFSGTPGAGVESVTVRQLLTMYSGLVEDGTLYTPQGQTVDQFLTTYLQQPLAHKPGSTYAYSNTNFTILQVLYEILSGGGPGSYVADVQQNILSPMGIDTTAQITPVPDPVNEAVSYSDASDTRQGQVWPQMQCVGPGGWLGTANGVLKFLTGIRANTVLDQPTTDMMFTQDLGWYTGTSAYGPYYHHNGGLLTGGNSPKEVHTGAVHFPAGYDAVLLVNSSGVQPIRLMARAFGADVPTESAPG